IVAEFVGGISLNEETAPGMNSAGPLFQVAVGLKLLPIFGALENINVRFDIGGGLFTLQFLRDHAIMEFRFDRHGCSHVTVDEVVNEMLGFGVLPLLGMNRERFFTE